MSSFCDLRPDVTPITLAAALQAAPDANLVHTGAAGLDTLVSGVTLDNRDCDAGWIFVALSGATNHGIRFATAAVTAGAVAVLTDAAGAQQAEEVAELQQLNIPLLTVAEPRLAAANIARVLHQDPAAKLKTFAVTGTNGKTTTTYLARSIFEKCFGETALCGTVETSVGAVRFESERTTAEAPVLYRFLDLAAQSGSQVAVVETSSHAVSFGRVKGVVFDVAGFTNLQHDHLDFYGDMETYFAAKLQLFTPEYTRHGVICVDDEWGERLAAAAQVPVTTYSALSNKPADWRVTAIHTDKELYRTVFTVVDPAGAEHTVSMPILGHVNVQNIMIALIGAVHLGADLATAIAAVGDAAQVPGRMQVINPQPQAGHPLVIVDYAHTPESLAAVLETAREMTRGQLIAIFGTDGDRDPSKRVPLAAAGARHADVVWITDENPRTEDPVSIREQLLTGVRQVRPGLKGVTEITTCRRDALRQAIMTAGAGDVVMITGKGVETYQDIQGIKHAYSDIEVAAEILRQLPRQA